MNQKTKALVLTVMAAAAAHIPLLADTRTTEAGGVTWQYTVTDGKASLGTGAYSTSGRAVIGTPPADLSIPAEIDGIPVVEIGKWALFDYYTGLNSVTIPEGVTNIAEGAFSSCRELRRVVIPASVKSIGSRYGWYAFSGCSSLEEVVFLGDINGIEMNVVEVFRGTPWLEAQDFSLVIRDGSVRGFTGRCPETVVIPDGATDIGYGAFDADAFPSATNLVHIVFPQSLRYIEDGAFYGCENLSHATFGREDYLTYYNMLPFKGTPFFDTLPFGLRLEWRSADGEETWLPWIVDYIGKCPADLDIKAVHAAQWEAERQKILEESDGYEDIGEVPAIKGIADGVFAGSGIKSVVLPASLSSIEQGAFFGCTNMTRVVFTGDAPGEIAETAFYVFTEGYYEEWGEWIPEYYGSNTNCTVYVPANSTGWGVDIPGEWRGMKIAYSAAFNVEDGILVSVVAGEETELAVPSGVTSIAANAFAGCDGLERIEIPEGVASIDPTAFDGCGKLWAKWFKTLERLSDGNLATASEVSLTVTNVVVHHVTQSVPGEAVTPPAATGFVTVIAEVNASTAVAIPSTWAEQFETFEAKFGSDFAAALTKPAHKRDGAGNAMQVWQDYVAGTDPTDPDDVFKASITFDKVANEPIISWTPELPAAEAAKRTYSIFGKVRLDDNDWTPVHENAGDFNFFRVTVEMK